MFVGCDPAEVDELAKDLQLLGQLVIEHADSVEEQLHRTSWEGGDADEVRHRMRGIQNRDAQTLHSRLTSLADLLRRQGSQQLRASAITRSESGWLSSVPGVKTREETTASVFATSDRGSAVERRKKELREKLASLSGAFGGGGLLTAFAELHPFFDSPRERLSRELKMLDGLGDLSDRHILTIDSSVGNERIVEVYGDLANAKKVIIHVPGMNTGLDDYAGSGNESALSLQKRAQALYGDDVAVVSFADYDVPQNLVEAADSGKARSGVEPLRSLVADLKRAGYKTGDISVVAHSFGTVVTGEAMKSGLDVGRVVALGSPGMGASDRAGLGSPGVDLYVATSSFDLKGAGAGSVAGSWTIFGGGLVGAYAGSGLDPVSSVPGHGPDPTKTGFGGKTFKTPGSKGHNDYFDGESLDAVAGLAIGN